MVSETASSQSATLAREVVVLSVASGSQRSAPGEGCPQLNPQCRLGPGEQICGPNISPAGQGNDGGEGDLSVRAQCLGVRVLSCGSVGRPSQNALRNTLDTAEQQQLQSECPRAVTVIIDGEALISLSARAGLGRSASDNSGVREL